MNSIKGMTKQVRLQQYAAQIQECKNSGMTVKAWCEENEISIKVFYYRQRVVRKALLEMEQSKSPALIESRSTKFVKLSGPVSESSISNPSIAININGIKIEAFENATEDAIKKSLKVVLELC